MSLCLLPLFNTSMAGLAADTSKRKTLVMVQLNGGNDGFNTLIDYNSDWYYHARPHLAVPRVSVLPLNDEIGFPPEMSGLHQLFHEGSLAVLPSVGYADMSCSHFRSNHVWHSGFSDRIEETGWLGRYIHMSADAQGCAVGETIAPSVFAGTDRFTLASPDAANSLSDKLQEVVLKIKSRSADVFYVSLDGFDTHANQNSVHPSLLHQLSEALASFQRSLQREQLDENVVTVVFSEFGRRLHENAYGGTDHGAGSPVLVLGQRVNGGIYSDRLRIAYSGDLTHDMDFRRLYATILDSWLGADSEHILCQRYSGLNLLG